ncbi:MAG: hypothetical protein ACXWE7_13825, partial [Nitrososphaeraceae archaeon]
IGIDVYFIIALNMQKHIFIQRHKVNLIIINLRKNTLRSGFYLKFVVNELKFGSKILILTFHKKRK